MNTATRVTLTCTEGAHRGNSYSFHGHDTFLVGRARQAHFRVPKDKAFSRVHLLVEVNPPRCRVLDMGSRNGTQVNGLPASEMELHDGDVIKAGTTLFKVRIEQPAAVEPAPPTSPLRDRTDPTAAPRQIGGYRIDQELGNNNLGALYLATSPGDDSPVALQTIQPAQPATPWEAERFVREAAELCQLGHPNLLACREVGEADGVLYYATDPLPGPDVGRLIERGSVAPEKAVGWMCQVLQALEYAHAGGFVHRDIKPSNILVEARPDGDRVRLANFGVAHVYQSTALSGLTLHAMVSDSCAYVAPERITQFREARPTCDLYSVAATLYHLLAGERIFPVPTKMAQRILAILQEEPVPLRQRRPGVPADLAAVVHRGLAKDSAERFADARALREALLPFAQA